MRAVRRGPPGAGLVMAASRRNWHSRRLRWSRSAASRGAAAPPRTRRRSARRSTRRGRARQPFVYSVTLTTSDGQPEGFRPPDFRGLRVLGGPFTQTRDEHADGRGGTKVENNVTWSYQLAFPPGAKGR